MVNYWLKALKEYNKDNKNEWCVPKKGSIDYQKVQEKAEIMKRANQNKKQKSKAVSKIQALVKGVQFRSNVLPNILFYDLLSKRNINA